jgi:hypothetical protein
MIPVNNIQRSGSAGGSCKIGINNANPSQTLDVDGGFVCSGSVSVRDVLTITPQQSTTSSSILCHTHLLYHASTPPVPYFSNGTSWTALY